MKAAKQRDPGAEQKVLHEWNHLGSESDPVRKKNRVEMEMSSAGVGRASAGRVL